MWAKLTLDKLNIEVHIITTDAMGCQKDIAKKIRKKKADYVLALKGNQGTLYDDVKLYFEDSELLNKCEYHKTVKKREAKLKSVNIGRLAILSGSPKRNIYLAKLKV